MFGVLINFFGVKIISELARKFTSPFTFFLSPFTFIKKRLMMNQPLKFRRNYFFTTAVM